MKRWLTMCTAVLLALLIIPVAASAEDSEQNLEPENEVSDDDYSLEMEGLINEWETSRNDSDMISPGYPDNVGHVYFDDDAEKVIVGLVNNNKSARNDIRSKVDSPEFLKFESSEYPYNNLIEVFKELHNEDDAVHSVKFVGDQGTSYVNDERFGKSGHEQRVFVEVDESVYSEYKVKYENEYGNRVYVKAVDTEGMQGEAEDHEESAIPGEQGDNDNGTGTGKNEGLVWLSRLFLAVLLGIAVGTYVMKRKRLVAVLQTADSENFATSKPLSRNQVTSAIKESSVKPREHVNKAILEKIKDQE